MHSAQIGKANIGASLALMNPMFMTVIPFSLARSSQDACIRDYDKFPRLDTVDQCVREYFAVGMKYR
jgi:hypothetical protein